MEDYLFKPEEMGGISLEEVIEAYYDCRRRKRGTMNAMEFEMDYERHCIDLWRDINAGCYEPRRSIAFVVDYPVKREIFAADFRDRVVHHLIGLKIYPLLEKQFITDSYSTQKGKGTLFGIQRMEEKIKACSHGYTRDCWVMKIDIQGYFMSISKDRVYACIRKFLEQHYEGRDLPLLLYLLHKTIYNRPEQDCILKVPRWRWKGLPPNKSLFGGNGQRGLPIGNLTSQLLALLFLDELDHLIRDQWGVPYYGRYVDDMVLVHESKEALIAVRRQIDAWLGQHGLNLHPRKAYLQHYAKGVVFVGGVIKPGRKYISRRTQGRIFSKIHYYNQLLSREDVAEEDVRKMIYTLNSYLGMLRHYESRRLFLRLLAKVTRSVYGYAYFHLRGKNVKIVMRRKI